MKLIRDDGSIEFEGTPKECGIFARNRDKKLNKDKKVNKGKKVNKSIYTKAFENFKFLN